MKPRITVITIGVNDLEASLRFYRDGLGFPTEGIIGKEFEHGAVVFIQLQPGLRLALWPRKSISHDTGLSISPASGAFLVVGLLVVFMRMEPRPEGPPPALGILMRGALQGDGLSITDLALLVLMVTPLVRVAVLAAGWTLMRQHRFAVVAFVVLGLLGLSLALGMG